MMTITFQVYSDDKDVWGNIGELHELVGIGGAPDSLDQRFLMFWACMQSIKRQRRVRVVIPGGVIIDIAPLAAKLMLNVLEGVGIPLTSEEEAEVDDDD
jgi:hypothetical protein